MEDIILTTIGTERNLEIEVSQGNEMCGSAPYKLQSFQNRISIEWECNIALVSNLPLQFTLKVRETTFVREAAGLKRPQSSLRDGLNSLGSMFFTKTFISEEKDFPKGSPFSSSFASLSPQDINHNMKPVLQKSYIMKSGQFNIANVDAWTQSVDSAIELQTFTFYQSSLKTSFFQKTNDLVPLGSINAQVLFLPASRHSVFFLFNV